MRKSDGVFVKLKEDSLVQSLKAFDPIALRDKVFDKSILSILEQPKNAP